MNKLKISLITLFIVSSVSAKTSVNVGIGAVARKTSIKYTMHGETDKTELQQNRNIGYFAGRVNVHAFYNIFGLRFSIDGENDQKHIKLGDIRSYVKPYALNGIPELIKQIHEESFDSLKDDRKAITSKSNFTLRIAPLVQYNINKFTFSSSIGGVYKNININYHVDEFIQAAENKHHFGFGGHVGVNYHFKSKVSAFVEISADFIAKTNNEFENVDMKFTSESNLTFAGCIGLAAKITD